MGLLKKFSLAEWLKQLSLCLRRFPVALLLLLVLAGYLFYCIHVGGVPEKEHFFWIFYPSTGAVLGISLQLLTEDFKSRLRAVLVQVLGHVLWLGISVYLAGFDRFSLPQLAGVSATVVAMVLSVFLLGFYRKGDDVPFWNFSQRTLVSMIAGGVVGVLLTLGLILFAQSLEWLFGVEVNDCVFADIPAVCMVLVAPLLFMSQIPAGEDKHDHQVTLYSGFAKGVAQYLFVPLLALYVVTLYVYAARILFTWQLPVGWVSYLVTASMVGMVALIYITYPLQHEQEKTFFKSVTRWMPLAMLPLLALMTVAIGRRLSDYGITVSRLYVVAFNLWCYVVCVGLLLCRNKRIWWIPASFAAVLFLISVGPWSIPSVTERRLLGEVSQALTASGVKQLPLTGAQYDRWLHTADAKVARMVDDKLYYLQRDYGYDCTLGLVDKDAILGKADHQGEDPESEAILTQRYENNSEFLMMRAPIPRGYACMTDVSDVILAEQQGNRIVLDVQARGADEAVTHHRFGLSINELAERDIERNHREKVSPLILDNGEAAFVVDSYSITLNNGHVTYSYFSGILFSK